MISETKKELRVFVKCFSERLEKEAANTDPYEGGSVERAIAQGKKETLDSVRNAMNRALLEMEGFDLKIVARRHSNHSSSVKVPDMFVEHVVRVVPESLDGSASFNVRFHEEFAGWFDIDKSIPPGHQREMAISLGRPHYDMFIFDLEAIRVATRRHLGLEPKPAPPPVPKLSDPCPRNEGRHELYINAGPGGKRDTRIGWQCCQSCGANGPDDSMTPPDLVAAEKRADAKAKKKASAKKPAAKREPTQLEEAYGPTVFKPLKKGERELTQLEEAYGPRRTR